jgi:hypothetical protein
MKATPLESQEDDMFSSFALDQLFLPGCCKNRILALHAMK